MNIVSFRNLILIGISMLLSACSLQPVHVPSVSTYTLNSVSELKFSHARTHESMLVSIPTASPAYQSSRMIYVEKPYELKSFANHRWVAAPSDMLLPLLVRSIQNTGRFHAVVSAPFVGLTDLRLDTQVLMLQQNFIQKPSQVDLTVRAELVNNKTNTVIKSQIFSATVSAPSNNPYGGVVAANQATRQVLEEIAKFVGR
ncbi:MAG: membrane integrity-associated transporter subunit PqiC [Proteobacteria bacterium]|nr:membrane integrity-associated transporter subunit PqiC [Pseudomonadota bacterium]